MCVRISLGSTADQQRRYPKLVMMLEPQTSIAVMLSCVCKAVFRLIKSTCIQDAGTLLKSGRFNIGTAQRGIPEIEVEDMPYQSSNKSEHNTPLLLNKTTFFFFVGILFVCSKFEDWHPINIQYFAAAFTHNGIGACIELYTSPACRINLHN